MNTGNGAGWVLDFSDRTFAMHFEEEFGIDIEAPKCRVYGTSKGKRLRAFMELEDAPLVAHFLTGLWDHRAAILERRGEAETAGLGDRYFGVVHQLQGGGGLASTDAIDKFTRDETLDELVAAIQRDITANKPQAALDRLHTYCMKKFAHLLTQHGSSVEKDEPLHSRAGRYAKIMDAAGLLQPISMRIMKTSISVFEDFNAIRNNKSFAHDNDLVGLHEARFIFDAISNVLRFIRSLEASRFGG